MKPLPFDLPDNVIIVRFDAPSGDPRTMPPYRILDDHDKQQTAALLEEIRNDPGLTVIVDLTGKAACGTMRLGYLLRLQQALRAAGRVLRIAVDQRELAEVFRLTRLNTIMPIYNGLTEAVADAVRPI